MRCRLRRGRTYTHPRTRTRHQHTNLQSLISRYFAPIETLRLEANNSSRRRSRGFVFRIINRSRKLVFEDVGAIQTRQSPHPWSNISSLNSSQETLPRPPLRRAYTRTDNAGEAIPFSSRRRRRFYFLFEVFRFLCPWRRPVRSFSSAWTKQASAISSSTTRAATRAGR